MTNFSFINLKFNYHPVFPFVWQIPVHNYWEREKWISNLGQKKKKMESTRFGHYILTGKKIEVNFAVQMNVHRFLNLCGMSIWLVRTLVCSSLDQHRHRRDTVRSVLLHLNTCLNCGSYVSNRRKLRPNSSLHCRPNRNVLSLQTCGFKLHFIIKLLVEKR